MFFENARIFKIFFVAVDFDFRILTLILKY
jgi:hypothetical protein